MAYTIDQFSKITNINKLVLRTWENRYGLLKAKRTSTNIRIYSDKLLVKALNIKLLIDNGYKISFISKKSHLDLIKMIDEIKLNQESKLGEYYYINKFIESAISYDVLLFNNTYKEGILKFGFVDFYQKIILVTFSKIGLFWLTNRINPGQEHFFSELVKQKVLSATDGIGNKITKLKNWLLFLPPNEYHEIGLIFSKFLLIQNGYEVIYLGSNVPLDSLTHISKKKQIDNILFFCVSNFSKKNASNTIEYLNKNFSKSNKFLVGNIDVKKESKNQIEIINDINHFKKIIIS